MPIDAGVAGTARVKGQWGWFTIQTYARHGWELTSQSGDRKVLLTFRKGREVERPVVPQIPTEKRGHTEHPQAHPRNSGGIHSLRALRSGVSGPSSPYRRCLPEQRYAQQCYRWLYPLLERQDKRYKWRAVLR